MIPSAITIKHGELPDGPGIYLYFDASGALLYIGKATSLKKRVGSYFTKAHNARIAELVSKIARIDCIETPTVIEALVLETNQIRAKQPPYNILSRDDKSFLYLCITNEDFPKPTLLRGRDLERLGVRPFTKTLSPQARKHFLAIFGPYISGRSVRTALDLVRRSIPWSMCGGVLPRACFDAQIGKCPGVCTGAISKTEYRKIIRQLIAFFSGKKARVVAQMAKEMRRASKEQHFELAAELRNKIRALEHINDVALITRDDDWSLAPIVKSAAEAEGHVNVLGRIEAYDIANLSGTSNVASMVVFEGGKSKTSEYRKFRIQGFDGADDVRAMEEVMRRRLTRIARNDAGWPRPDLMIIDGGEGQVNRVKAVMQDLGVIIPVIGIAKGFDRKQDRLVYDEEDPQLRRIARSSKEILQRARDEAHRFAGAYHRVLRAKRSGIPKRK